MRKITMAACQALFLISLVPATAPAQFTSYETRDLRLIYNSFTQGFLAPHVGRCFENAMAFYRTEFGYEPSERVTVFLDDRMDCNNAAAWSSPRNTLWVQIAPTNRVYETAPSNERINHTMNHELAHIVMQDQAAGSDVFFRHCLFGKVAQIPEHPESIFYSYLTQPRRLSPQWYHEGAAVFLETWLAGGVGRAQGPYDEMVFRAKVLDGSRIYDPIGVQAEGTRIDFQAGANAYLYGARFMNYLAYRYGPENVIAWIAIHDGDRKYYTARFAQVFGLPLEDAWRQWIAWERGFQSAALDSIRRYPLTPYRDLTERALGSVSRAYLDEDRQRLYVAVNFPGVAGHLAAIDMRTGGVEHLTDIIGPAMYFVTSLAYDPAQDALFFTSHNYEWRDLYRLDLSTGKVRRLIKDARIGDLVINPADHTLWGIRHFDGIATVVRLEPPYTQWHQVYSPPYGTVFYDIDLSPDGRTLACACSEINGRQTLRTLDTDSLLAGNFADSLRFDFGNSLPGNFVFSPDDQYLYGNSYYTGISNIWRYDLGSGEMVPVTNCETGMFRPVPTQGDSLVVFRYAGEGFLPAVIHPQAQTDMSAVTFLGYLIAENHPVVRDWNVGSPREIDIEQRTTYAGPYHGLAHLGVAGLYPVVQGYKDFAAFGVAAQLSDPGYVHAVDLDLTYSGNPRIAADERWHGRLRYARGPWTLDAKHNVADFYDLFGPLKTSRKGQSLGLRYHATLLDDKPQHLDLSVQTAGYVNLERLPYAQNIAATFDRLWQSGVSLDYQRKTASLGAVNPEKGYGLSVNVTNNFADGRSFPQTWLEVDVGTPFLAPHSSLWLHAAGGYSPGDPQVTFANFYFGGFQNNWVDHREIRHFEEVGAFPGVDIDAIGGVDFTRALLEWDLPPVYFRHYGTSWFYLTWLRAALFTGALVTNLDRSESRTRAADAGIQIDLRTTLLSRLDLTWSAGYAVAVTEGGPRRDETMVSVKILR